MNDQGKGVNPLGRRALLRNGALLLATGGLARIAEGGSIAACSAPKPALRFAMVTDLHFADKPPQGSRHYRETPVKLAEAAERFQQDSPAFLVELGDLIDAAESVEEELRYLEQINRELAAISDHRHYVLGNHCVATLTKDEFLRGVGQERSFKSFDVDGFHFIVLDSCFRADGEPYGRNNFEWTDPNIITQELEWLADDLEHTASPTFVFAHQRLDVGSPYGVKNAPRVRQLLEASGKVRAVFQGHSHKNDYRMLGGIHYVTLVAMVEGSGVEANGYTVVDLEDSGLIRVHGFRKQESYEWTP